MKYSIIITYYQGYNILCTALELLHKSLKARKDVEIIVVNDNPQTSIHKIENLDPFQRLRVVDMEKNGGYSLACNKGVAIARGDYVILMDCDIFVTQNWLAGLEAVLMKYPNAGCISSTILDLECESTVHWGMSVLDVDIIKPFRGWKLPIEKIPEIHEFPMITSGCMLVSRNLYEQIHGMDPVFLNGYCDLDFSFKCRQAGYRLYATTKSIVYHRGKVAGAVRLLGEGDPKAMFFAKWFKDSVFPTNGCEFFVNLLRLNGFSAPEECLYLNFSRSLSREKYKEALKHYYRLHISEELDLKYAPVPCLLEDFLSWNYAALRMPIIYFTDNINQLRNNSHWYYHRKCSGDLLLDRNGNVVWTDDLINT